MKHLLHIFGYFAVLIGGGAQLALAGGFIPRSADSHPPALVKPVAVFGEDDRKDLPEELGALEGKIGMLYEQSTQTLCTAFCVAKGIVATAAHCLFQHKNGKLPNLSDVTFRLNYGKTFQQTGIFGRRTPYTKHFIAVGTTAFNNEPPLSAPRDWALVKLEDPVCRFGSLKVETRPVRKLIEESRRGRIFQVAYHWDYKHWKLAFAKPCKVERDHDQIKWRFIKKHFIDYNQLLLHKCDTGGASSGSPILLDKGPLEAPVVVAINVGTYTRTRILLRKGQVVKKLNPDIIANTGVNGSAFKHVIEEFRRAQMITNREDMAFLQNELKNRNYYKGVVDGELGRGTRNAIVKFETNLGLRPTGLPSLALLQFFEQERVKPAHTYSNANSEINVDGALASEEPRLMVIPNPIRRQGPVPKRPKPPKKPEFNPFRD